MSSRRRPRRWGQRRRPPSAVNAPRASTRTCSSSTATTRWPSWAACTWRASSPRSCWRRRWSGDAWPPTWSSRRATCATTTGPADAWRATVPPELVGTPLADRYVAFLDEVFTTYGRMYEPMETYFKERFPKEEGDSDFVYRQTMLAKTCDTLRVLVARGHPVEPGDLRHRAVLRTVVDAPGGASARRDARGRRPHADRTAQGDPGVPEARRRRGARRRVVARTGRRTTNASRPSPRGCSRTSSPRRGKKSSWLTMTRTVS